MSLVWDRITPIEIRSLFPWTHLSLMLLACKVEPLLCFLSGTWLGPESRSRWGATRGTAEGVRPQLQNPPNHFEPEDRPQKQKSNVRGGSGWASDGQSHIPSETLGPQTHGRVLTLKEEVTDTNQERQLPLS